MIEGLDTCESCRMRVGAHRDDVGNRCLCTECWGEAEPVTPMDAEELREYGEAQHAEGFAEGFEQALVALEAYAGQNPGARAWDCLAYLRRRGPLAPSLQPET